MQALVFDCIDEGLVHHRSVNVIPVDFCITFNLWESTRRQKSTRKAEGI